MLTDRGADAPTPRPSSQVGLAQATAGFLDGPGPGLDRGLDPTRWSRCSPSPSGCETEGKYSDGVRAVREVLPRRPPPSRLSDATAASTARSSSATTSSTPPWMALLANQIGVPARVVMGAVVPEGGRGHRARTSRRGSRCRPPTAPGGRVPTEAFMDFDRPAELPPREEEEMSGTNVPPPAADPAAEHGGGAHRRRAQRPEEQARLRGRGSRCPAWLSALLLVRRAAAARWCWPWPARSSAPRRWRRRRRRYGRAGLGPVRRRLARGHRPCPRPRRRYSAGVTRREESLALAGVGAAGRRRLLARDRRQPRLRSAPPAGRRRGDLLGATSTPTARPCRPTCRTVDGRAPRCGLRAALCDGLQRTGLPAGSLQRRTGVDAGLGIRSAIPLHWRVGPTWVASRGASRLPGPPVDPSRTRARACARE